MCVAVSASRFPGSPSRPPNQPPANHLPGPLPAATTAQFLAAADRCQQSVEKLAPWVWLMQSLISLWYLTDGRKLPQARAARKRFGEWDTEWSLAHMLRILRAAILDHTITPTSATKADLQQLLRQLETYLNLAV